MQSQPHTWITAKGEVIPYDDLEDGHLLNILSFLLRRSFAEAFKFYGPGHPKKIRFEGLTYYEFPSGRIIEPIGFTIELYPQFEELLEEACMRFDSFEIPAGKPHV